MAFASLHLLPYGEKNEDFTGGRKKKKTIPYGARAQNDEKALDGGRFLVTYWSSMTVFRAKFRHLSS